jgi:hypothetical protein
MMYDVEQELRDALHDAAPDGRTVPFEPIARRAKVRRNVRATAAAGGSALAVAAIAVTAISLPLNRSAPVAGRSPASTAATSSVRQSAGTSGDPGRCVRGQDPTRVKVDYIDFVRMNGLQYRSTPGKVRPDQVGPAAGTVLCTLATTQPGPGNVPRDGDAAFLPAGTVLHAVQGYPPSFRLVANVPDHGWVIYEVSDPELTRAEQALPPRDAVTRIEVLNAGLRPIGKVTDPAKVRRVLDALLAARVQRLRTGSAETRIVRFVLADGTSTRPWVWNAAGATLDHAIRLHLPADVNTILRTAS